MDSPLQRPPDPAVVERFVLGQLPEPERIEVERLLEEDSRWREAVEREQRLAAGVRRLGRDRLRERLKRRLLESAARAIPWPRVLAAAASVIIIVGILVVNQWMRLSRESVNGIEDSVSDLTVETPQEPPLEVSKDPSLAARAKGPSPAEVDEGSIASDLKRADHPPPRPPRLAGTTETAELEEKLEASAKFASKADGAWTQAQLYRPVPTELAGAAERRSREEAQRADNLLEDEDTESARMSKSAGEVDPSVIVVDQRTFASLTPGTQARVQSEVPDRIPALVEHRRDTLHVILYPTALFDSDELGRATVEAPTEDSLLITIARQQIGLRLPSGSRLQQHGPARR